ncbi:hypothetical protein [Kitasatospora sp. NPDC004272]
MGHFLVEVGQLPPKVGQHFNKASEFAAHQYSFSPHVEPAPVASLNPAELTGFLTERLPCPQRIRIGRR